MNWRRVFIFIILAFTFVGCEKKDPGIGTGSWTQEVWERGDKIYNGILRQPFLKEMAAGTLAEERFARYIAQDEVYIGGYGRQMYQLADLMEDPKVKDMLRAYADSGIESEKAMHQLLIDRFGIDTEVEPSVVTAGYRQHTQDALDGGDPRVALAAMLPCMWIYNRVGLYVLSIAKLDGNPYREWIEEYGNEEVTREVDVMLETIDGWMEKVDAKTREAMTRTYLEALLYEYAFWDYGYSGDEKDYSYVNRLEEWL